MSTYLIEDRRFKKLPTTAELGAMERDLRFHPVNNATPGTLASAEIERFNKDGYLKGYRLFSDTEITDIRHEFDSILERVLKAGGHSYSIISAHLKTGMVYDILKHPNLLPYLTDLLGTDVVAWGAHFFCKMPGDGKIVSWHQDASYWPLTPSKTATVWLAIDDADTGNACMRFISGSHHFGHLTFRMSEASENSVLNQTVENVDQYGTPVDVTLNAGEISIHSDLLLHGSELNLSNRRRCGLTMRFCAAEVRAQYGWNDEGVIISGSDPTGHWTNNPRPPRDLI